MAHRRHPQLRFLVFSSRFAHSAACHELRVTSTTTTTATQLPPPVRQRSGKAKVKL